MNRKKILLLVNDLTMTPIVIADINIKNKKEFASDIPAGIRFVFSKSRPWLI